MHFTFRLKVFNVLPQSFQKPSDRNLQTQASSSYSWVNCRYECWAKKLYITSSCTVTDLLKVDRARCDTVVAYSASLSLAFSISISLSLFFNFVREHDLRVVQKRSPLCSRKWEFGWPYGFLWPSLAMRTVYIQCICQSARLACNWMPRCTALHRRTCRSQNRLGLLLWNYRRIIELQENHCSYHITGQGAKKE